MAFTGTATRSGLTAVPKEARCLSDLTAVRVTAAAAVFMQVAIVYAERLVIGLFILACARMNRIQRRVGGKTEPFTHPLREVQGHSSITCKHLIHFSDIRSTSTTGIFQQRQAGIIAAENNRIFYVRS